MKKALLISTNAIGDAYLTASAIPQIKNKYPKADIDFICSENALFLIRELEINNSFAVKSKNILFILNLIFNIRETEYDIVICPFPGRLNSILYSLCKGLKKAGFVNYKKVESWDDKNWKLNVDSRETDVIWKTNENFLKRIELCLNKVIINSDQSLKKLTFPLLENKKETEEKYAVCHFNSRIKAKNIDNELINTFLELLMASGYTVKIIDADKDMNLLKSRKIEIIPISDLKNLVNLIENCSVYAGVDSFPIHIADAYNRNIIGMFHTSNPYSILNNRPNNYHLDLNQAKQSIYQQFGTIINGGLF